MTDNQKDKILGIVLIGIGFLFLMPWLSYCAPHVRFTFMGGTKHVGYGLLFIEVCSAIGIAGCFYGVYRLVRGLYM